ncbi:MAG TPA: UDP-glucose/GDP-mannose dehydrogenase family protein [Mycobacteriales bacterium]|jgi:UDPglucose 6-dehydrogenase|nr:UDP-glucose/GDP-mannose dehydrogenase family protein [Mycobacteriales bacterium]
MTARLRLTVIGTGYLGATHAAAMAELGFDVVGVDVDQAKVDRLSAGEVPFFEPGLEELLRKHVDTGRLRFTTSYSEAGEFGDVHFLCVGTPQKRGEYAADLTYVDAAVASLTPHLREGATVVGKSTVPVGTAERLATHLDGHGPAGVELAWNPEFLREGYAVEDTLRPDRLVFGVRSERGEQVLREVYASVIEAGSPVVVCDLATAQLVKVAANAFLATKISFINAMAEVCETVHGDVKKLSEALSHDSRIGGRFLHAGLGFGGGCLPKDIRAFMARAGELGVDQAVTFLKDVDAINMRRRERMVELARDVVGNGFTGVRVGVLGAAFKPNSDDIRDSPALDVSMRLHRMGAQVTVYDPAAIDNARRSYPDLTYVGSAVEAATDADVVLHLTEWREFRDMDPAVLSGAVRHRRIVDGRNALDPSRWRAAGWTYRALGRP